ncbi:ATP-dependent zinc protease [Roseivirga sp.]|uniref:ATP-dependent zinc protease family protein n=1 Tax=Roseivirga sp. TaxID=1964215 RepID=UPI003B525335
MFKKAITIGRADKIDLPDFQLFDIDAKVDSGAYTSAINCSRVKVKKVNGESVLSFYIPGNRIHEKKARKFSTTNFVQKRIKSSNGEIEERYVVRTHVELFGHKILAEFSLSDRSKMKYPILLGRKLLRLGFVVDVRKKNLSFQKKYKNEDSSTLKK